MLEWQTARVTGWTPEYIRWELPFVDLLRYRAAELFLEGFILKRTGLAAATAKRMRRARIDGLMSKYRRRDQGAP